MNMKNVLVAMFATAISLVAVCAQAVPISIPVTNPGAETGDLTGWSSNTSLPPNDDYSAVNNPAQSQSGAYYFGLDLAVLGDAGTLAGNPVPVYGMNSIGNIDLSAYNGTLDELFLFGWGRTGGLTLNLDFDDGTTQDFYQYEFTQTLGVFLRDISGNTINGLAYGTSGSELWAEEGGTFSWWSEWNAQKDNIYSVSVFLDSGFDAFGFSGSPDLSTLDPNNITDAFYSWEGADGNYYEDFDFSLYSGDELPVIGFDNLRIELTQVAAVPVPAGVWLFASGLIGLARVARRKQA